MRNTAIAVTLLAFVFASCQKEDIDNNNSDVPEKTEMNVSYGSHPQQKMDLYLPANRSEASTRLVILIHGGAWSSGDKADFNPYIDTLKKRLPGYAIININYRLASAGTNIFPTQETDVKAALDFIYSKRAEYKVSEKWVLLGNSAGAHLALLQAYKYTSPVKIKAVVDFYGPADMVAMYNSPASPLVPASLVESVVGGTPTGNPVIYNESSPINYVTAQSPPTIILHGGLDVIVSFNQSAALKGRLETSGVVNQYVFYPTENHGWVGPNLTDSFNKIALFLQANVN